MNYYKVKTKDKNKKWVLGLYLANMNYVTSHTNIFDLQTVIVFKQLLKNSLN